MGGVLQGTLRPTNFLLSHLGPEFRLWDLDIGYFIGALIQKGDEDLDRATVRALKDCWNTTDDLFITWIRTLYFEKASPSVRSSLRQSLLSLEKIALIQSCFNLAVLNSTRDFSLHSTVLSLLSRSERISTLVRPVLERISDLPVPFFLQLTYVSAPILPKLGHMVFIYIDPYDARDVTKHIKNILDKIFKIVTIFFHLRFFLIRLDMFGHVLFGCAYIALSYLLQTIFIAQQESIKLPLMHFLIAKLLRSLDAAFSGNDSLSLLRGFWSMSMIMSPFSLGVQNFRALYSSSVSIEKLKVLFQKANRIQKTDAQEQVDHLKNSIHYQFLQRKISSAQQRGLNRLVDGKRV